MNWCYIISPDVLISNTCLKCDPEIGRFYTRGRSAHTSSDVDSGMS